MRAYFFNNMYLSSIQQGIQAAHVVAELFVKYHPECDENNESDMLAEWACDHKTMVLLNGHYSQDLLELESFFEGSLDQPDTARLSDSYDGYSPYPFELFRESGLDDIATSFGCILPPKIYEGAKRKKRYKKMPDEEYVLWRDHNILIFDGEEVTYTEWEKELMQRMNQFKLAT